MTPTRLTLRHYCQHEALEAVFAQGMNSMQGANGSGKSNLLDALRLCLSLESGNPGKLTDNIQDGHQRASLDLEFTHRDSPGSISIELKRNYSKNWDELSLEQESARARVRAREQDPTVEVSESWLKLAVLNPKEQMVVQLRYGGATLTKVGEIKDWIRNHVGLDPKVVSESYFPRQGDVDGALSGDRETRQRVFHDKAGTAICQKLWDELGKELRGLPDLTTAQDREQELAVKEARARAEHAEWAERASHAREALPDVTGLAQLLEQHRISTESSRRHLELVARQGELQAQQNKLQARLDGLREQGQVLSQRCATDAPRYAELRASLDLQRQLQDRAQSLALLETQLAKSRAALASRDPGARQHPFPEGYGHLAAASRTAQAGLEEAQYFIKHFGTGQCPTCKQGVPDAERLVQEYQKGIPGLKELVKSSELEYRAAVQASQAFESWFAQESAQQAVLRSQCETLSSRIAETPAPVGLLSPEEISRASEEAGVLEADQARLAALRQQYLGADQDLALARSRTQEIAGQVEMSAKTLTGELDPAALKDAHARLLARQSCEQELRELETEVEVRSRYLADVRADLGRAQEASRQNAPLARWRTILEQVRDLVHRDALPAEVVAWYADQLVRHTMTYLKMFDAEFELFVARDLTLMGMFADKTMPVSRLSGGQKNMLNISMRLAMLDMFPSELRLLILDEVEVHLDQRNVAKLPIVLERVKGLARGRELVVLFVSHHPSLSGVADHIIHLQARAA